MTADRQGFDDDPGGTAGKLTQPEESELKAFSEARTANFAEIMGLIAVSLGYDSSNLSRSQAVEIEEHAEEACESSGEQTVEVAPITPLQMLLREHWRLGEKIADTQETAIIRGMRGGEV